MRAGPCWWQRHWQSAIEPARDFTGERKMNPIQQEQTAAVAPKRRYGAPRRRKIAETEKEISVSSVASLGSPKHPGEGGCSISENQNMKTER
jgi:hypothetical protein